MRHKRYYIVLAICLLLSFFFVNAQDLSTISIERGSGAAEVDKRFGTLIEQYVNNNGVTLHVDGKEIPGAGRSVILVRDRETGVGNWLISADVLTELLYCYVGWVGDEDLTIARGENKLQFHFLPEGGATVYVNGSLLGQEGEPYKGVLRKNDTAFVSAKLLQETFDCRFEWNSTDYIFSMTRTGQTESKIYPAAYDYRKEGRLPHVGNQGSQGTCWAFTAVHALESSMLPELSADFSQDHMIHQNSFGLTDDEGGRYSVSLAYLLSWQGPVGYIEDPYNDGKSNPDAEVLYHVQNVNMPGSKDFDAIKRNVFLYGGVQTSIYFEPADKNSHSTEPTPETPETDPNVIPYVDPNTNPYVDPSTGLYTDPYGNPVPDPNAPAETPAESEKAAGYYNPDTYSYCYIGTEKINHDVVIVGWDDTYPKSNFNTEPEGDGAFICLNSWGESFGEGGCFYVSYYDTNIGIYNLAYKGVEDVDTYEHIYQTDLCGWIGSLGFGKDTAYFANVYTAESDESLRAVGFYTTGPSTTYEVYVESAREDYRELSLTHMVAGGSFTEAGYHTVPLDRSITLYQGQEFVIAVKIETPGSAEPIAVEFYSPDQVLSSGVDISDGEGYISSIGRYWTNVEKSQKCNLCLKAYTVDKKEELKAE
ncbi:MAG: hypothetical protein J5825_05895 [Lachnospiraceae bacterium]|nr:hypothetical protein [Lachnospiraceae bacterium]